MNSLIAPTEDFIFSEKSKITAAATAGSSVTLVLESNDGLAQNDYVVVKKPGHDQAHICKINAAVSGNTDIQVDTLKHDSAVGDEVTKIRFNQRKFYGCATESGTYTEITDDGSPKDIEVDNPNGTLFEYTASTYLYFKATYYNSQTTEETDIGDAIAVLGGESDRFCSINDIRQEAGLTDNQYISDSVVEDFRISAESEIKSSIYKKYSLPLSTIPKVIKTITKYLAAGGLLYKEYGSEADGTSKDGLEKLKQARSMLKSIRNGTLVLLDDDDAELTVSGASSDLSGWPDSTTEDKTDEEDAPGETAFRINKDF